MASFVFIIGVSFCLSFVSYIHAKQISIVNGGDTRYAEPGENVTIEWKFDQDPADLFTRTWRFISKKHFLIAYIYGDGALNLEPSSIEFQVKRPATLILKNVNDSYNGTYTFGISPKTGYQETSAVTFSIAVKPSVAINCSSTTIVNEGNDVRCLCTGQGGNPPANVSWYDEDGKQIGVAGDEEKMLTFSNIDKTASGTYKCIAQSDKLKNEKLIEVFVYHTIPPTVVSFTSTPEKARVGKTVVITCEAIAVPVPRYTIIYNNTEVVSTVKTLIINVVKYSHVGSYECIAKNKLGNSSKNYHLSVVVPATRTTHAPNTTICATEKAAHSTSKSGTEWYTIVITLPLSGIIIGILISCIFVCSRHRFQKRKRQSKPVPESSKTVNSIYQDLDLSKMNSGDNYESLRVDSGRSDADYEKRSDSAYTELNKVRGVENDYQSLT